MATSKLNFSLAAYDPNPSDVCLAFDAQNCVVESSKGANVSIEEYKTTPEGNPSEIFLKVTPDPIAFVMKFVDGRMMIEFKGNWSAFQVDCQANVNEVKETRIAAPEAVELETQVQTVTQTETIISQSEPQSEPQPEPVPEEQAVAPAPPADDEPAFMDICFKVHFVEEDVDAFDIRMRWDFKEFTQPDDTPYVIVYQSTNEDGAREFVIAYPHPTTGELFILRGHVKGDKVTISNTEKFDQEHVKLYISFYIKDPEKQQAIFDEIEKDPTYTLMIMYKNGIFAEAQDFANVATHVSKEDKDNKPLKSKDKEDDDHVRKAREQRKKAEEAGKKGSGPPEGDGKDWSCGRVKWQLPPEEKKFRDVGKLKIPDFGKKEEGPHTKDVGKLKWGGFVEDEPKEPVKEKPKVGKLNLGAFGGGASNDAPPPKRSWKKKNKQ